jgi:ankyrin repeat protein
LDADGKANIYDTYVDTSFRVKLSMSEPKLSEFYIACRTGDLILVELLLNSLSLYDLNRLEANGSTALHAAAFYGHIDIVRRLVIHGAIMRTLRNKYNLTPAQETTDDEIRRLLEPDATYEPRKRFISDDQDNKQQPMSTSSTTFSPVSLSSGIIEITNIDEEERLEWLDAYNSAHRIAQENHEYMRKWLTKLPLTAILETINNDYVDNPSTELTDKHRAEIHTYIEVANYDDDPRHLVYAYTLETNFYRQLNRDLAQRG